MRWKSLMAFTAVLASGALPASAQELPRWSIAGICTADSAGGQCRLLEAVARQDIAASWSVLPVAWRERCLLSFKPPLEPSWRSLESCIEGEASGHGARVAAAEAARQKAEIEAAARQAAAAAAAEAHLKAEAEAAARQAAAAEARRKAEAEAAARQAAAAAEARRKAEADAVARQAAAAAETRRKAEAAARQAAAAGEARRKAALAVEARRKADAATCKSRLASIIASGSITFKTAEAELETTAFTTLDMLADAAKGCANVSITVEGHTDSQGSAGANQTLSQERAEAVAGYLVEKRVPKAHIKAVGYGAKRPVASNDTAEGRASNRRIVFAVE